jgi:hypothetical protein
VYADKQITGKVPKTTLDDTVDLTRQLRNVDKIFARVFPQSARGSTGK